MKYLFPIILALIVIQLTTACNKDKFRDNPDTFLRFSRDTVAFDTVFTTLGSVTRSFKIHNDYEENIVIDKIFLRNQSTGTFRLNIDGKNANQLESLQLAPHDSTYIFVETTIQPDNPVSISPFIIEDYIDFELYGHQQSVLLSAFGQNANYIPNIKKGGNIVSLCNDFGTVIFDDPKPYVIYGIMLIDSCTLSLPPGCEIYVHGGIGYNNEQPYADGIIAVTKSGTLQVNGTTQEPVRFQGVRLEEEFKDVEGQWAGIFFLEESQNSYIHHAEIANSIVGVRLDSSASLSVKSTVFSNQSSNAVYANHADQLYLENCLMEGSLGNAINFSYGGKLDINYCTISGFGSGSGALAATNYRCIEPTCTEGYYFNPVDVTIKNTIIVGDAADQIVFLDKANDGSFTYQFDNSITHVDELLQSTTFADFWSNCNDCLEWMDGDTLFVDLTTENFHLDTMSIAEGKAIALPTITQDLDGVQRDATNPDIGCFEFVE